MFPSEEEKELNKNLCISVVITIVLLMFELPNQIRIFDFFSAFVRQLNMILVDSAQIVTMLAFVVFFFMFIFWVLDKTNSDNPDIESFSYPGGVGLIRAIIDSYRMALGDFEITTKF